MDSRTTAIRWRDSAMAAAPNVYTSWLTMYTRRAPQQRHTMLGCHVCTDYQYSISQLGIIVWPNKTILICSGGSILYEIWGHGPAVRMCGQGTWPGMEVQWVQEQSPLQKLKCWRTAVLNKFHANRGLSRRSNLCRHKRMGGCNWGACSPDHNRHCYQSQKRRKTEKYRYFVGQA